MHKIDNKSKIYLQNQNNTRYDLGNPFERKTQLKVRPLCTLSLNRKWL